MNTIVKVADIKKYFWKRGFFGRIGKESVRAVDGVTFQIEKGKTFGLVGESGCGKSTVARLLAGILKADSGSIDLGGEVDIVFQDPFSSLNPRMTVKEIVSEGLRVRGEKKGLINERVEEVLHMVRLRNSAYKDRYPHQFSGGERQRVAIARALIRRPGVLILDEPVSSLDVSIQAGILNLLKRLQEENGLTYIFISHDLRVVEFMSDTVGVMKAGRLLEVSSSEEIYHAPKDPYTRHLLASIPFLGSPIEM